MFAKNFRDLEVWQLAMKLCRDVYLFTKEFPSSEKYGLTSQLRRASISVPSNIAEGFARRTAGDKKYLMTVALGSLAELATQIELAESFN